MRPFLLLSIGSLVLFGTVTFALASLRQRSAPSGQTDIERGRYLVEEVAKCTECHTPRDANNQLDPARWLQGAATWIEPVHPVVSWAEFAPSIAGLVGITDEQAQRVLEMGVGLEGKSIQPPMHLYHLNHADAQAVIAYLRSLPPRR